MKTTLIAIATILLVTSFAFTQTTTLILESNLERGSNVSVATSDRSMFTFAQACRGWGQVYVGRTYSPAPWCEVALGAGFEKADNPWRLGGWVWVGQGHLSAVHCFEQGGSGPWHLTKAMARVSPRLSAGLVDRAFYGRGVTAEYKLGNSAKLSGAWYEGGATTLALGLTF